MPSTRLPATVLGRPLVVEAGGISYLRSPPKTRLPLVMLHVAVKIAINGCQMGTPGYNKKSQTTQQSNRQRRKFFYGYKNLNGILIKIWGINGIVGGGGLWQQNANKMHTWTQFSTTHHTINIILVEFTLGMYSDTNANYAYKIQALNYLFFYYFYIDLRLIYPLMVMHTQKPAKIKQILNMQLAKPHHSMTYSTEYLVESSNQPIYSYTSCVSKNEHGWRMRCTNTYTMIRDLAKKWREVGTVKE